MLIHGSRPFGGRSDGAEPPEGYENLPSEFENAAPVVQLGVVLHERRRGDHLFSFHLFSLQYSLHLFSFQLIRGVSLDPLLAGKSGAPASRSIKFVTITRPFSPSSNFRNFPSRVAFFFV